MLQIHMARGIRATKDNSATDCILLCDLITFKDKASNVFNILVSEAHQLFYTHSVKTIFTEMAKLDQQRQEPDSQSLDLSLVSITMLSM